MTHNASTFSLSPGVPRDGRSRNVFVSCSLDGPILPALVCLSMPLFLFAVSRLNHFTLFFRFPHQPPHDDPLPPPAPQHDPLRPPLPLLPCSRLIRLPKPTSVRLYVVQRASDVHRGWRRARRLQRRRQRRKFGRGRSRVVALLAAKGPRSRGRAQGSGRVDGRVGGRVGWVWASEESERDLDCLGRLPFPPVLDVWCSAER